MSDTVLLSRPEPGVALITLNRPERLNAMTAELVGALHARLDQVADDPTVRVVVLTGAGRAFCAGLDLTGYGSRPPPSTPRRVRSAWRWPPRRRSPGSSSTSVGSPNR